jgi:hypothetical protein
MGSRYAGGDRLSIGVEAILAAERNSFADRIKAQRQVEAQDLCRFGSAWRSPHDTIRKRWPANRVTLTGEHMGADG